MSACPSCSTPMKPLFSGEFCPNACDKPQSAEHQAYRKKLQAAIVQAQAAVAAPRGYAILPHPNIGPWAQVFGSPLAPSNWQPGPDDCRDPYCRAKGTKTATTQMMLGLTWVPVSEHYKCNLCSKEWDVSLKPAGNNQISVTVN